MRAWENDESNWTWGGSGWGGGRQRRRPRHPGQSASAATPVTQPVVATAEGTTVVSAASAGKAALELRRMKRTLEAWLRYRTTNDKVAAGQIPPRPFLARPGAKPLGPGLNARVLSTQRATGEAALAADLHALLSEVFDSSALPSPDLRSDPDAAVKLAMIAISGRAPGEGSSPAAAGFVWLWPAVIVVGAVTWVITSAIRNRAEVEKERERYECIKAGACTDTGFWMKAAAIGGLAALAWWKLGLREKVMGIGGRRRAA
jgi:hypothetical protein